MPRWLELVALLTALATALVAGTFFAFSSFVMPALARLQAAQAVAAMNSVNLVIVRSLFLPVFFGAALACLALGVVALVDLRQPPGRWLLAGSLLYLIASVGVTVAFNVPLNDALATVAPGSAHAAGAWTAYVGPWTGWNTVRAVASLLSTAALILACLRVA